MIASSLERKNDGCAGISIAHGTSASRALALGIATVRGAVRWIGRDTCGCVPVLAAAMVRDLRSAICDQALRSRVWLRDRNGGGAFSAVRRVRTLGHRPRSRGWR